jgi:hypothetical protein
LLDDSEFLKEIIVFILRAKKLFRFLEKEI